MPESPLFPPTVAAAWERVANIRVADYARTRNHLDGAVTRLSPYLTHGLLDVLDVVQALRQRHADGEMSKLLQELAWREFFSHVQRHQGEAIFENLRTPAVSIGHHPLPADVLEARTGVPVIDASVRELYASGYLHNHARMWLASYLVHLRKVRWQAAADWMFAHLLDGDLASNHLSWQWCASTFSAKPYLFNHENVLRFAPALGSPGSFIDRSYEALDSLARADRDVGPEPGQHVGITPPPLLAVPNIRSTDWPRDQNESLCLVHPWDLGDRPRAGPCIGVIHLPFHARFPWSAARWQFVLSRMNALCDGIWMGDLVQQLGQIDAASMSARANLNPGYREALEVAQRTRGFKLDPIPRFTLNPSDCQSTFSAFWRRAERAAISRTG